MRTLVIVVLAFSLSIIAIVFYASAFQGAILASSSIKESRQQKGNEALQNIGKAIRLSPLVSTYPEIRARYYLSVVRQDPDTKDSLEPLISKDLNKAIRINPWYHRHYIRAAITADSLGRIDESVTLYSTALLLVPNSSRLRDQLASELIKANRPKEALPILDASIRITNDNGWSYRAYFLAGVAYDSMEQSTNAAASILRSLERAPNSELCKDAIEYLTARLNNFGDLYENPKSCQAYANAQKQATP